MPERRTPRFDPDERFVINADPEDVLRRLLEADDIPMSEDEDPAEADDA